MKIFKRAFLNIRRLWLRNVLLLSIVFILGLLLSFSLSVRNSIAQLDSSLMERLMPIVAIVPEEQISIPITMDMVYDIESLPYVKAYHLRSRLTLESFNSDVFVPHFLFEEFDEETKEFRVY